RYRKQGTFTVRTEAGGRAERASAQNLRSTLRGEQRRQADRIGDALWPAWRPGSSVETAAESGGACATVSADAVQPGFGVLPAEPIRGCAGGAGGRSQALAGPVSGGFSLWSNFVQAGSGRRGLSDFAARAGVESERRGDGW